MAVRPPTTPDTALLDAPGPGSGEVIDRVSAPANEAFKLAWPAVILLALVNTFNHLDRQIISILAEPIKVGLSLNDVQIGLLTGLSFAALYGLASLPMAYLADRGNRPLIVAVCLSVWSLFTALGGAVQNFWQLVASRVVVGLAEAGGSAPAQSLVADITPASHRARAFAIFSVGIPLGSFLGMGIGGVLVDNYGWRTGFVAAGLPGLLLALALVVTLREPRSKAERRAHSTPPALGDLYRGVRDLLANRTFFLVTAGGVCVTIVNYGQTAFLASHIFRTHKSELDAFAASELGFAGLALGASALVGSLLGFAKGLPGVVGTLWGGQLSDSLTRRRLEWLVQMPAIACLVRIPFAAMIFVAPNLTTALVFAALQAVITGLAAPAGYAAIQGLAKPQARSLAAAVYTTGLNVVGLGLGPLTVGLASDWLHSAGFSSADGLKLSLLIVAVVGLGLGGWLKWSAGSSLRRDLAG